MKTGSIIFLKAVILLIGIVALVIMIRLPLTEGRAANLDLLNIYADPFIIYGYVASIPFFIALYQVFKLLGYIGQNKILSPSSVKALRAVKYCAIILGAEIVATGAYIRIFHAKDDDPAGFLAMCIVATFISIVIAVASNVFEKLLETAVNS